MDKLDFNKGWLCECLNRKEKACAVTLPHDAMLAEPRKAESLGEGNIGWFLGGDYLYSKCFDVPACWKDKEVLIEFEGVYHHAEVWINGKKAGYRPYGYTNFYVDMQAFLYYGRKNEIRVIARNLDQPNSRWYTGAGIYRPVYLHIGEKKHIPVNGVKIRTVSINPATVEIEVATSAPGTVCVEILDGATVIKTVRAEAEKNRMSVRLELPDVQLWSCDTPKLYTCRASFGNDVVSERFGVRQLLWDVERGLTLNGERVILRGACVHHDNGILGACAFPEAEERKVRILKENGYNALRSAHNPCSKALLDACDRFGMLVMDEYVDAWYIHKTENDYVNDLMDWWHQDLKDMVDKDYNHPSVIMYSIGNEVSETAQEKGIRLTGQMTKYLHELDDTRPVTCGINIFFNFLSSVGFGVYTDEKAKKNAEAAKLSEQKKKKKPVGSEFYNTLACMLGDYTMKLGATLPPCDWKTRDAFANLDIAGYNYGIFRYKHDLRKYPQRLILGTETFCKDAYSFWEIAKRNVRILGDFVWPGMEYIGETNGAPEFSDYRMDDPATRLTGGCGRIDLIGKPGAEAAYTRVALEQERGPIIAVLPVYENENVRLNGWQLTKARESWSWRGCEGSRAVVEVYARAAEVELWVNGVVAARKRVKKNNCRTLFDIPYENGELTAVSYDHGGREIGRQTLKTAGADTLLRMIPEAGSVRPGGLVFVRLQYTDPEGIWKPMEKHMITVEVDNGELMALGTANPYREGRLVGNRVETYFGDALAVVRAENIGIVRITACDENNTYVSEIKCEEDR